MDLPINKNRSWIAELHKSIDRLDEAAKAAIMKPAGKACAADIIVLCERYLGIRIVSIEHLITAWNMVRAKRELTGRWEYQDKGIRGIFRECGCPLVRSGMVELHPAQCYCSQGMMETIFSQVAGRPIAVEIVRTIGRGDEACEFLVKP
jgi:predicted hydrocarbon binding protein